MQLPSATSASTELLSPHQAPVYLSTRQTNRAPPSHHTESTAGISALHLTTTDVTTTINSRQTRRNLSGLVSTPNSFSQIHNRRLPNPDRRGHSIPHTTRTSINQKKPTPSLTYGSKIINACTEMEKLLQRAPEIPVALQVPAPPPKVDTPTQIEQPRENPSPQIPARPPRVEINNQQRIRKIKEYHKTHLKRRASILQQRPQMCQTTHQNQCPNYRQIYQAAILQDRYQHHIDHLCTLSASPQHFTEGSGRQGKINKLVAGPEGPSWTRSLANEFRRFCTGIGKTRPKAERIEGTGTMFFTTKDKIPKDRKITYANFICNIRQQKSDTHRVRLTAGGDKLDYPGDPSSPAVSLLNVKIHINSTISRAKHNARYM